MRMDRIFAAAVFLVFVSGRAVAQGPAGDVIDVPIEEVIVVGTRTVGRVATDSPVPVDAFNSDAFDRTGATEVGRALQLLAPSFNFSSSTISDGTVSSFRMGYGSWSDQPAQVVDSPVFGGWDPEGLGFAIIGASVAYDCALAISWYHAELRTCLP